ncbi:alcohol dehydrogenase 1-like [Syngnathus acus]|uniref:alcohol dehydrogenase 1-like n=1 Tax=Syngnathus acus TaxID=161584 RepID=UPI001885D5E5|nr:alcohol dehydrogenase 1-like [Syngnathus acus]
MATAGKVIKCKAAVAWQANKPLTIEEIEVEPPQENQVRVKMVATGVCRTDLFYLNESDNKELFPMVLGHEGAGIVESVGPGVTEFQPGDKVIPLIISQCRECRFCKSPKTNQCEKAWHVVPHNVSQAPTSKLNCKGKKLLQFMGISTFSQYSVINQIALAKIDPAAPLEKVFLLGCGICTGFGAAVNNAQVEPDSTCAVFGLGAVGLAAIMGCKYAGAKKIIAVDINADKFDKAKEFGATDFVNPKDHDKAVSQVISEMTNGGVDFSLECVGDVKLMRTALESCIPAWGVSVIVGWTDQEDFSARPNDLIGGRTWKGSVFGGFKGKDGVAKMVRAYMDKKVKLDEFITHQMTLDDINEAVELLKEGKSIRTFLSVCPQ